MGRDVPRGLAHYIRDVAGLWRADARTDRELLSAFVSGDGSAFAALVVRHGQTVWTACRRVLGNDTDAEDAFQATFIALARNAARVRSDSISGWLQKVPHTAAVNARRRNTVERQLLDRTNRSDEQFPDEELRAVVDDEVARLPERIRVPLTLYYLKGKTQVEIGRILGVTDRAAAHRLKQALKLLRDRLVGAFGSGGILADISTVAPAGRRSAGRRIRVSPAPQPSVACRSITPRLLHLSSRCRLGAGRAVTM